MRVCHRYGGTPVGALTASAGCLPRHAAARAIRAYLRGEVKLTKAQHLVAAYWRRGQAAGDAAGEED
jgi:hypothetical protein